MKNPATRRGSGVKMKTWIGLTALALAVSGCGAMQRQQAREAKIARMNSLVGQPVDELIKTAGPPTSTFPLTDGGAVFEYSRSAQVTRGGGSVSTTTPTLVGNTWVYVPQQQTLPIRSDTMTCKVLVTISAAHLVERWKESGSGC